MGPEGWSRQLDRPVGKQWVIVGVTRVGVENSFNDGDGIVPSCCTQRRVGTLSPLVVTNTDPRQPVKSAIEVPTNVREDASYSD